MVGHYYYHQVGESWPFFKYISVGCSGEPDLRCDLNQIGRKAGASRDEMTILTQLFRS